MSKNARIGVILVVVAAAAAVLFLGRTEAPGDGVPAALDQGEAAASPALPRLVDLGSDRCIPCKKMAPILADLEREFSGRMTVEVIDVRRDRAAAETYGIRVIPTQIFYDAAGRERYRHEGFMSREAILAQWHALGVSLDPAVPNRPAR